MMSVRKLLMIAVGVVFIALVGLIFWSNWVIEGESKFTYDQVSELPHHKVGLVLGCIKSPDGRYVNPFFQSRMEAACRVYQAGKIDVILVSGDNHVRSYDEATDMKNALIGMGIPSDKILCDYAGFTTLDSIVRAKEVFKQNALTIISQKFHNERAIYIAQHEGMSAVGYNAQAVELKWALKIYLREFCSRMKVIWDVKIIGRKPKFLGEPIEIKTTKNDLHPAFYQCQVS